MRASMEVMVRRRSQELVQIRHVCMDRGKKNLAYLQCYLRMRNPARITGPKNDPSTVLDSFTFLD